MRGRPHLLAVWILVWASIGIAEPPPNFTVAFIGDQSLEPDARAVAELIVAEGADAVVHSGDFDYEDNPSAWEDSLNLWFGVDFPYFASIGNHDKLMFHGPGGYQEFLEARLTRLGIPWDGDLGVKSSLVYQGMLFLLTGPGTEGSDHEVYIRDILAQTTARWRVSSWHRNMRLMQVGGKDDDTGWGVYEESRRGAAIIATGHSHTYSRTHLLSSMTNQTVADSSDTLTIRTDDAATTLDDEGRSFVFVSGLGGRSIRDQEIGGPWWASIYTSTQNATYGALFGVFHYGGDPGLARFYFKAIDGTTVDAFYVRSEVGGTASDVAPNGTSPELSQVMLVPGNPSRGVVTVRYTLARATRVRVSVHDVRGRLLLAETIAPNGVGPQRWAWHPGRTGYDVSPGVYFVQLATPKTARTLRVVWLRDDAPE